MFLLSDAIILNSLCKMFGLLESVKQALHQRRSESEESKIHDSVYGERGPTRYMSWSPTGMHQLLSHCSAELDDILEEKQRLGCVKNTSYKPTAGKHLQRHNLSNSQTQNLLSPISSSAVIQPLSLLGLSAAPYNQLSINPQHAALFSASASSRHPQQAEKREERRHELGETGKREKLHRMGQEMVKKEETSGIHHHLGQSLVKFEQNPQLGIDDAGETGSLLDSEKAGRKASKKHKSK